MVFKVIHVWLSPMSRFLRADLECEAFRKHKLQISWSLMLWHKENRVEREHLDVIGATEEMMCLMVVWEHDYTAEPLGTGKFLLPGPMQTCLVQNSGTGSTRHLFGFNSSGDLIVQARLGPLPTESMREHLVLSWRSKHGRSPGWLFTQGERPCYQKLEIKLFCNLKKKQKWHHQECLLSPHGNCESVSPERVRHQCPEHFYLLCFHDQSEHGTPGFCHRGRELGVREPGSAVSPHFQGAHLATKHLPLQFIPSTPAWALGQWEPKSPKSTDLWGQEMRTEEKHTMWQEQKWFETGFLTTWHSFQQMWWFSY